MAPKGKSKGKPSPSTSKPATPRSSTEKSPTAAAAPSGTSSGPSTEELFKALDRHVRAEEFKQIIKVADQILQSLSGDKDALECKVVAYIQLDEYDQALSVISSAPSIDLSFHKAYCLYKRNRIQEALASLKNVERNARILQLEAQILFKAGNFSSCISSYQELLQNHKVDSDEVKSNIIAAYVSGERSQEVQGAMDSMKVSPRNNFNLAYNAGCALIEAGELSKAEEHLLLARRIGQETLIEDEYPEKEIEDELAPISVQLSYVQQVQGNSGEASEGYNTLIKIQKPADEASMAVASNNLIALRGARDLFDALKKFDRLFEKKTAGQRLQFTEKLEQRLSARQKEAISFNRFLLLLHSNKLDQARDLLSSLSSLYPESEVPPILAASLALKEGKASRAEDGLEQYAAKDSRKSTPLYLAQAQVSALSGNLSRAAESLEKISELQHQPGMVATLVALKERAGDVSKAEAILDAAVEWWDNHMGDDKATGEEIVYEAAVFKLSHNNPQAASQLFQRLTNSSSAAARAEALNGLVRSTALSDPSRAEGFEKKLSPLPGLRSIDVEALERAAPTSSKRARGADEEAGNDRVEKIKAKKKRKKKPLYPKNFDPANPGPPPDPERWLPRRERSSFRPRKKDKRAQQQQIRGAQGSVSRDKTGGDASANGPQSSSSAQSKAANNSATRTGVSSAAPEASKPTGSSSKNKKKGRR